MNHYSCVHDSDITWGVNSWTRQISNGKMMEQNFLSRTFNCDIIIAPKSRKCYIKFDMHWENEAGKVYQIIQSDDKISAHHSPCLPQNTAPFLAVLLFLAQPRSYMKVLSPICLPQQWKSYASLSTTANGHVSFSSGMVVGNSHFLHACVHNSFQRASSRIWRL